ncbi:MAG: YeeE/YedE family protein [Pseudotabrizicola sp.]|uniref:YeeE/YedE family protein n=1 Tax=Pseudotabrizicola sp. TaxID=2939647 RepID=UPI002728539E|nr:YeeE/YedE family protein [Pseudotabrizicola sp.]MDO8883614.1 YeeE/YedE family protein [Pseudotabrizicola sp.]MDP2081267.1 YeeE/YedE family protein [Pseudotabrizicola sp.]MDZ7576114.1 YeeE/YedE family protein [Pseudotabrizicola sp.]
METLPYGLLAALVGLVGGTVLGLAARLGDFCTLGALEAAVYGKDQMRLRLWGIVLGIAILGTQLGALAGWVDLGGTFYHSIVWNPLGSIFGGLVFGYGMAMAGNCGFGALVRFGGGDLRSLVVVVVMGIFGFVALSGPLAPARILLFPQPDATGPQGIVHDVGLLTGLPAAVIIVAIGVGCLIWALSYPPMRAAPRSLFWGVAAGLAVVWCFAATTWVSEYSLGAIEVEGLSFTAPVGRTLIFLMTSTAGGITFSVGAVVGVMAGALIGSTVRGLFRWEACEDPRELGRQVGGAVLMGIGGVVAMGCSVGQGVSAFAALAWSGPVTLAAIIVGALFGLHQLISGYQPD